LIEEACRATYSLDALEKRRNSDEGHFCIQEIKGDTTPCLGKEASGVIELMIATARPNSVGLQQAKRLGDQAKNGWHGVSGIFVVR
jgi:hypothetical protein